MVTGASGGLDAEFARQLAARGCHLIPVARREELLQKLRQELLARHPVDVQVFSMAPAEADAPQKFYDAIKAAGLSVDILINNAGSGSTGNTRQLPGRRNGKC